MSVITINGNLVFDAEAKQVAGHSLTKLRVASNDRIKGADGEWKDGDSTFIDVTAWRKLAAGAAALKKGQRVVIVGKLKGRSFTRADGSAGYGYEVEATDIGLSVMPKGGETPAPAATAAVQPDLDNPWGE